jgi:type III secretion system TyeA family effector delivery regulator
MIPINDAGFARTAPLPAADALPTAASTLELAAAELGRGDDALAETLENMSFALGGRARDARGRDKAERELARLQPLLAAQEADGELDALLRRFADAGASGDPLAALRDAGLEPGQVAWLTAAMQGRAGLGPRSREAWREAWRRLSREGGWEMPLFARLHGVSDAAGLGALAHLHRRAQDGAGSLASWLGELAGTRPRGRVLRALLRTLSYDLSGAVPLPERARLAAAVRDVERVLHVLGMEESCRRIAESVPVPGPDAERVLDEVIALLDMGWANRDAIAARCDALALRPDQRYPFITGLFDLVRALPDACLRDDEQRTVLGDALGGYRDLLAERE